MTEDLQLFCEDMNEQLTSMENTLLDIFDIPIDEVDSEMINNLFRAMHTMKGNSSMFGFDIVVSFAHVAENLLNEIRNGSIKLTSEMLDLFLLVNDHSRTLIELAVNNEPMDDEQLEYHNDLLNQLSVFLGEEENYQPLLSKMNKDETQIITNADIPEYNIIIKPKDSFFASDMDIIAIIKYLDVIGDISDLKIVDDEIVTLQELKPLQSYISISLIYKCEEPLDDITGAFEFIQDDIELSILQINEKIKEENRTAKKSDITKLNNFSLRVDSSKVDKLINLISEMVITNSKITQIVNKDDNTELISATDTMTMLLEEIRTDVMDIRMVQVGSSFNKLRRIVNETAKKLGKDIEFIIKGEETELDKTVVEKISDPLVHMLRNSIDHGIEPVNIRVENGKHRCGKIELRAYPDAGAIIIEIEDDGAGINKDVILQKAIQNGLVSSSESLSEKEIYNLIFEAGLSTATEVSDVSGRGVGMDVVRRNIEELNGSVDVDSKLGQGSKITIRLPLTLAIIDGFLVQSGQTKYIIPLEMIQECIKLTPAYRLKMSDNLFINLRSEILPLIDTNEYFETKKTNNQKEYIVIINVLNKKVGLIVNELHGEFQTVIKPLGEVFENITWISGGTILGDGEVALILDVPILINSVNVIQSDEINKLKG